MNIIQLKLAKDANMLTYIKLIRSFDRSLSINDIKTNIEQHDVVVAYDLDAYDVVEDIKGIDRREEFCVLIKNLCDLQATIQVYHNEEAISLAYFYQWIETMKEIELETERDIDRELGECED